MRQRFNSILIVLSIFSIIHLDRTELKAAENKDKELVGMFSLSMIRFTDIETKEPFFGVGVVASSFPLGKL